MSQKPAAVKTVLVDCHVHFFSCYEKNLFFDRAESNFSRARYELGIGGESPALMLFAETSRDDYFHRFGELGGRSDKEPWRFRATADPACLVAERSDGCRLYLVAGRQVATKERLEVLALNSTRRYQDGRSLRETLDAVWADENALAVIPWGFGKWWFHRGDMVSEVVGSHPHPRLYLGDNGGRLRLSRPPRQFSEGSSRGVWVLPGSDPLPLASEATKAGRYGCLVQGPFDEREPARSLAQLLMNQKTQPKIFGRLESPFQFCRAQAFMQMRKLGGRSSL
jgi:hypothetical protein